MPHPESGANLSLKQGISMAQNVLQNGQIALVEQMKGRPDSNLFFRWPAALHHILRLSECVFVIADPKDVKPILVDQHENIEKGTRDFRVIRDFLGNALVPVAGGDAWYNRRKLLTPTFSHTKIAEFGNDISSEADKTLNKVTDTGNSFALREEMTHLTLRVINKFLFNENISDKTQAEISWHITSLAEYTTRRIQHLGFPPKWFPSETNKKFKHALAGMHKIIGQFYDTHNALGESAPNDMLSVLMNSRDEETQKKLTKQEVIDECLSMLIAGHETTSNTLTWAMYLLAKHPEIQDQIRQQVLSTVGNKNISIDDLKNLPQISWALKEAMRLYPPVWVFSRKNNEAFTMPNGQLIPKKTFIAFVPWLMHRNPKYWKSPDTFNPERFNPISPDLGVKEAFMPFGMGQRRCVGSDLAFTEASLVLAKTLQHVSIDIAETVEPALLITTRPNSPVITTFTSLN